MSTVSVPLIANAHVPFFVVPAVVLTVRVRIEGVDAIEIGFFWLNSKLAPFGGINHLALRTTDEVYP